MRILKLKIAKALQCRKARRLARLQQLRSETISIEVSLADQTARQLRIEAREKTRHVYEDSPLTDESGSGKRSRGNNVMKNYARAMVNFSLSALADPYLERMKEKYEIDFEEFRKTLRGYKAKVNCIKHLRELLLVSDNDSEEMKTFKKVFQELCIVFMKFFSVNWIYHGKMFERNKYLQYRGKMLRRVQNPEYFTYLESFVEKKKTQRLTFLNH